MNEPTRNIPPWQLYERADSDDKTAKHWIYFWIRSLQILSLFVALFKISSADIDSFRKFSATLLIPGPDNTSSNISKSEDSSMPKILR